jgi:hypothetical protein
MWCFPGALLPWYSRSLIAPPIAHHKLYSALTSFGLAHMDTWSCATVHRCASWHSTGERESCSHTRFKWRQRWSTWRQEAYNHYDVHDVHGRGQYVSSTVKPCLNCSRRSTCLYLPLIARLMCTVASTFGWQQRWQWRPEHTSRKRTNGAIVQALAHCCNTTFCLAGVRQCGHRNPPSPHHSCYALLSASRMLFFCG